jgi:serine/threonine protein kinase
MPSANDSSHAPRHASSSTDDAQELTLDGFPSTVGEPPPTDDPLDLLLVRYTEELRAGGQPSMAAYLRAYPHLSDGIRELFPLIESLEQWKGTKEIEAARGNLPGEFPLTMLGSYRLLRELGRGGAGIVFAAEDTRTGRRVAVKVFPWRFLSDIERRRERFYREAATIARLRHRHIIPVHSYGEAGEYRYYVMELVEGVDLDWVIGRLKRDDRPITTSEVRGALLDVIQRRPEDKLLRKRNRLAGLGRDSWPAFAKIGTQVASALAYAHKRGVVHHDIKPGNLLLDAEGRVVVGDFGVANPKWEESTDAPSTTMTGTLRYMSPERLEGQSHVRSDIYALGASLYELVTREPLFDALNRQHLLHLVRESKPRRPRELSPTLPAPLETIILTALSPDPEDRYPSARDMAVDLIRFLRGAPVKGARRGLTHTWWNWYRKVRGG